MTLITLAVPVTLLDGVTGTPTSDVFALPTRAALLSWQTSFNTAPAAVSISLQVSIDGVNFVEVDSSTAVAGEVKVVSPVSALFIKVVVATNTGDKEITVVLLAKASA